MTYLLDTNVVSELRKAPGRIDARVAEWGASLAAAEQYLSVVTVFEVELGILRVERRDAEQAVPLRRWFEEVLLGIFAKRTLALDRNSVRRAAAMHVPDPRPERDAYIAATALEHGLTVATRNTVAFVPLGVLVIDPWQGR